MKSLSRKIFPGVPTTLKIGNLRSTCRSRAFMNLQSRHFSENTIESGSFHSHFKASGRPHPLGVKTTIGAAQLGDHTGLQQNHIWTLEELEIKMKEHPRHQPATISDQIMNKVVTYYSCTFRFLHAFILFLCLDVWFLSFIQLHHGLQCGKSICKSHRMEVNCIGVVCWCSRICCRRFPSFPFFASSETRSWMDRDFARRSRK